MLSHSVSSENYIQTCFSPQLNSHRANDSYLLKVKMAMWLRQIASDFKVPGSNPVHFLKKDENKRIYLSNEKLVCCCRQFGLKISSGVYNY